MSSKLNKTYQDYVNQSPKLNKQQQRALWDKYDTLVKLLRRHSLTYSEINTNKLKAIYKNDKAKLQVIRGGIEAGKTLVHCVAPMALNLATRYSYILPLEELFHAGLHGASYSLTKFKPYGKQIVQNSQLSLLTIGEPEEIRETKFSSYARMWIFAKIQEEIKQKQLIKLNHVQQKSLTRKIQYVSTDTETFKETPSDQDTSSLLSETLALLNDQEQEILECMFDAEGNRNPMTNALNLGVDIDTARRIEDVLIHKLQTLVKG